MGYELYHHGIKGQKWGVRRYQNPDGSLTLEGYQRYGLNPDGSRHNRGKYSRNTKVAASKGFVAGGVAGIAAGSIAGPVGSVVGAWFGSTGGALLGTAVGAIQTKSMRSKITKLLDENKKVYVKDL